MSVRQAYNQWSSQYDHNENKTRDLEATALRETLGGRSFQHCLEVGCGTGKNTVWLADQSKAVLALDLSEEMMAIAKSKLDTDRVQFRLADITQEWNVGDNIFDLVSFSLVLEHVEDLGTVFKKTAAALRPGGFIYVGELHPFKQYTGSKARFETEAGVQVVPCFNHHLSDFTNAANNAGLQILSIQEYFDEKNREGVPRLLVMLLQKKA